MKFKTKFGLFALICAALFAATAARAVNGLNIGGTLANINITDKQSTNLYDPASVTDTDTNILTVYISFSPSSLGGFQSPLPTGVVHSNNFYVIDVTNVADATTLMGQLTFTPINNLIPVPNTSNVTFQVYATDAAGNTASTRTTTVHITSTNDAPTLTVSGTTSFNITDKQTVKPLGAVSFNDVDNSGNQPLTVTVSIDDTNKGTINAAGTGFTTNGSTVTFTGTDSAATVAIANLVFIPTENRVPVGQSETTTFTVQITDTYVTLSTNNITVAATSVNDAPTIAGVTTTHQTVQTGHTLSPFSVLSFQDVDPDDLAPTNGQSLNWSVTLSGPSPLGTLELGGFSGTNYSSSGYPNNASAELRNIIYRAPSTPIGTTNTLTLTITADDRHGGTLTTNVYIDLYSLVSPPGLSGTASGQRVNDNTTIALFSGVTIQSFNGNSVIVRVGLSGVTNETQGQLVNLSGFVKNSSVSPPIYEFSGTSEAATTAIRALLFQPTSNRINGSSTDTAVFGITLIDGPITNATDTSTTVIITPVNDTPTLIGISPLVTIQDTDTVPPFPTVLISDVDELGLQPLTITVTLDNSAKGAFSSNSLVASGFTVSNGVYTLTASTNSSAAIRQLIFVPTPNRVPVGLTETTTFTVKVDDWHGGVVQNSATQIRVAAVSGIPIVTLPAPQPVSIPLTSNIYPFALVTIADATAVNVGVQINNTSQGSFTAGSVTAAGFTDQGGGVYTFSGTASNATTAIEQLNFSPGVGLLVGEVVNFSISVTNQIPNYIQTNLAVTLRKTQNSVIVTTTGDYDPNDLSVPDSAKKGTLRKAIVDAGNNDHITFDIRSTIAGTPDYPATIHLVAPLVLNDTLTFDGPGADALTITGDSNVELVVVTNGAIVQVNRLAFTGGHASFAGGGFEVTPGSTLKLSYCSVTDCSADVWGGGIDVDEGTLNIDHCLIARNITGSSVGQGGGGISIYTDQSCTIANTTFATNRQTSVTGLGGGGLYVENADPGTEFDVFVVNCTFHDNRDAANHGTSIRPNVFNTYVQVQNSIVADGQGKNLEMDDSGTVLSLGGNISDDSTTTTFSTGGGATNIVIFHPPLDYTNTNPQLLALANNGGPTFTYALSNVSAAISNASNPAVLDALGADQRGYFRDSKPDIGAYDLGASKRIIVEEFAFNPAAPNTNDEFIEFYVPRDSTALNIGGFKLYVGGTLRHTFSSQALSPGEALVLFSHDAVNTGVPSGVYKQICATDLLLDNSAGTFALKNSADQTVLEISYVSSFVTSATNDPGYLTVSNQSLVLSPQFQGVYLPYQRVVAKEGGRIPGTNELSNPGYDAAGNPLAIGNSPPRAYDDSAATDAQTPITAMLVLTNDIDLDATDTIRVVGVGVTNGVTPGVAGTTNYSTLGAQVIINSGGASIIYDPTKSAFLTSLPQGSNVLDTFQYTILDSSNGVDHTRGADLAATNQNLLKATATVRVSVTGVNEPPVPVDDSVSTSPLLTTAEDQVLDFTTFDNLLGNDTDPNTDDNTNTLRIVSIEPTSTYIANSLQITTALGATATLDIRFDRTQSHITYDPRGSATLNALGQGQTAVDTFYYSVMDRYNTVGTAAVHISVTGVNDPPTANPDNVATDEDTPLNIPHAQLLANDTDPDNGTVLQVTSVTPTSAFGASVTISGTNVIYDPRVSATLNALARKEVVIDTFTYTATDDHGLSSNAVVSVTVTGVNDAPISAPDAYRTDEKTLLVVGAPGVLANDTDPDVNGVAPDDVLNVLAGSTVSAAGAPVTFGTGGNFSYDPRGFFNWLHEGQTTSDTFSYVVLDHSLTVANNDTFIVQAGSSSNLLSVLANDADLANDGGTLTITNVSTPNQNGSVAINSNGTGIYYSTPQNFVGTETFNYTVSDGQGGSDTASVTVQISALSLNANADSFTVARGTTVNLDVLVNDSSVPAASGLTITALGTPNKGGLISLNGTGANNQITYTPTATNASPYIETFTYQVSAGGQVATGSVTVTVIDRTSTLTANDDTFTVLAGTGTAVFDVLANDNIIPGTTTNLFITGVQTNGVGNNFGTLSINGTATKLVYRPPVGVTSQHQPNVTYTISDGAGGTATGNLSIIIISNGLFANDDVFTVVQGSASNTLPVMVNDGILPNLGQNLLISAIGIGTNAPQHGTVLINGAGKALIYTPNANFVGEDNFTYEISDGSPNRAFGHVKVKVINYSVVPSNPDFYSVARDSSATMMNVLKNDYVMPITPGSLKVTALQTNGVAGTVSINGSSANNSITYTPATGFIGQETFQYVVTDSNGDTGTNVVTVNVGSLITQPDTFTVLAGSVSNSLDVLVNDHILPDTAGRPLSGFGVPNHNGSVSADASRLHVLYTPAAGFTGSEQFTYQVTNDSGAVTVGTATVSVVPPGSDRDTNVVTITITGVNDVPTLTGTQGGYAITDKQTVVPFAAVTIADLDDYGLQPLTVTITLDAAVKGQLTNLGGFLNTAPGVYTMQAPGPAITTAIRGMVFVPTQNRITVPNAELATFTISLTDGFIASPIVDANTTVNVTAAPDAPTITGTLANQKVYAHSSLAPFSAVTIADVDDLGVQPLSISITLDQPTHGYLTSLGSFAANGAGVYSASGVTPAQATAALRGIIFVPTVGNRLSLGGSETNHFSISVNDGFTPAVIDNNTSVISTDSFVKESTNTDGTTATTFGYSVAASRDFVVAGTPRDTNGSVRAGTAYIYSRNAGGPNTWTQVKKLTGTGTPAATDLFGNSVAISSNTIAVGATGTTTGAAYVFDRNQGGTDNWGVVKRLSPADGANGDLFGVVAIDGDVLVVGASHNASTGTAAHPGGAYVYTRNTGGASNWGLLKKLVPADGVDGDDYGFSVSISGDTIAIGARANSLQNNSVRGGAVYIYDRNQGGSNNWGFVRKVGANDGASGDLLGHSVSISGDLIVAGAPWVTGSVKSGAVYAFQRNQGGSNVWGQVHKFTHPEGATGTQFGSSVAVDGELMAFGTFQDVTGQGAVFNFSRNFPGLAPWSYLDKLVPSTNDFYADFGFDVALKDGTLAAGAKMDDGSGNRYAITYIFQVKFDNTYLAHPIPDQWATAGIPFTLTVPPDAFADTDYDKLTFALAASPIPPGWLTFDTNSATFGGTPTVVGAYPVAINATDPDGTIRSTQFTINVAPPLGVLAQSMQGSSVSFVMSCVPGFTYRLQRTSALDGANTVWIDVAVSDVTVTSSGTGVVFFSDVNSLSSAFYRVVLR